MEASALSLPGAPARRAGPLRVRSDESLVALFRAGSEEAFEAIVGRYEDKLLAYARHVLRGSDEAQDVVQDAFIRAHGALRRDEREMNLKPWLYRIVHNRCMDVLRRPAPVASDEGPEEAAPLDTIAEVQRRHDLRELVADIDGLPDQQRSALVIRELGGLSYDQLAETLDTTVPAIKSLLVRARMGLAEASQARALPCDEARAELLAPGRPTALVRRHVAGCDDCRAARDAIRPPHRRRVAAAFLPLVTSGPFSVVLRWLGLAPAGAPDQASVALTGAAVPKAIAAATSVAALGGAVASTPVAHHAPKRQPHVVVAAAPPVRSVAPPPARQSHVPALAPSTAAPKAAVATPAVETPPAAEAAVTVPAPTTDPAEPVPSAPVVPLPAGESTPPPATPPVAEAATADVTPQPAGP